MKKINRARTAKNKISMRSFYVLLAGDLYGIKANEFLKKPRFFEEFLGRTKLQEVNLQAKIYKL